MNADDILDFATDLFFYALIASTVFCNAGYSLWHINHSESLRIVTLSVGMWSGLLLMGAATIIGTAHLLNGNALLWLVWFCMSLLFLSLAIVFHHCTGARYDEKIDG